MIFPEFKKIILGSGSPRRKQLLEGMGLSFLTEPIDADESFPSNLKAEEIALYLCQKKAHSFKSKLNQNEVLITADTIVWINNRVLNKPATEQEAVQMLTELSDATHFVYTGVNIQCNDKSIAFYDKTEVKFAKLSESEILFYIQNYKPYDKAGSYGAQEWMGYIAIEYIGGSYFNVMGLPVHLVYKNLKELHANLPKTGY